MNSYGQAAHGKWCGARTFPMTCKDCGEIVFYFTCNCGSKVFFNSLGDPWPKHNCLGNKPDKDEMINWDPEDIEEAFRSKVRHNYERLSQKNWKPAIRSILPEYDEKHQEIGVIREIVLDIDIYKKFHLDSIGIFGHTLLRELEETKHSQITVHVEDLSKEDIRSYTFFIISNQINGLSLKIGDHIEFEVISRIKADKIRYWKAKDTGIKKL